MPKPKKTKKKVEQEQVEEKALSKLGISGKDLKRFLDKSETTY